MELTLSARSIRAVSSLRSRSSDSGSVSSSSMARESSRVGLGVRPAPLLRLRGDEVQAGGALGGARQVEVLGDQRRLGAVRRRCVSATSACVCPAHVEDLGLVGGVAHQRMAEAVGARPGRRRAR